ncbi:MAG: sugar ABC transporter permease [Chloroflexi bacterium]|nr:MAG: sugar ABC transporter permease [Chloroflexota bacterium]
MAENSLRKAVLNPVIAWQKYRTHEGWIFWFFVGPMVLGLLLFVYIPIVWGFILSFFEARNTVSPTRYIGLTNYTELFADARFLDSLKMIVGFSLFIVPVTFAISLGLALLVNSIGRRWQGVFRTVFFIPVACSYVVASLVWKMSLFNGLPSGFANNILWYVFGMNPIAWINTADPPLFWVVLVTVRLWLQTGFYMIIFLAGLQEIPRDLYEAAAVDGAKSGWQTFRHITFPLLYNTSVSVLLLLFIEAFQAFDEFRNIMGGAAVAGGTQILARPPLVYLYNVAFQDQNYGRGAAGAFIIAAMIVLVTIMQGRVLGFGRRHH